MIHDIMQLMIGKQVVLILLTSIPIYRNIQLHW